SARPTATRRRRSGPGRAAGRAGGPRVGAAAPARPGRRCCRRTCLPDGAARDSGTGPSASARMAPGPQVAGPRRPPTRTPRAHRGPDVLARVKEVGLAVDVEAEVQPLDHYRAVEAGRVGGPPDQDSRLVGRGLGRAGGPAAIAAPGADLAVAGRNSFYEEL